MKQSFTILLATGSCAIAATFLAWIWGGQQEDVGTAIGGIVGLVIANGMAVRVRRSRVSGELGNEQSSNSPSCELGFAYGIFAILFFALVGWLSGHLHGHGELAGIVCGGLGGYILAVLIPAVHRSSFLAAGRKLQLAISGAAFVALVSVVWAMYQHEFM
ncbi:hypothetical protein NHH03_19755 [Stieleria sp. TO1_6]|uniref:hypothetical protein n=1 Tax=Stieleria tagensis TaxID=2956795 RepID=UPI00209AE87D|nr:hypothetical protein [Stieleria tagensis]MCO8123989.1 hypothetical protein [Stieleria tagensis]